MIEKKKRSCNLDVIRIFAFLCVVSVHFFRSTELYYHTVSWGVEIIPITLRNFFMICVPLFMTLSGYLLINRTPCKTYYLKIFQTIGIYVLASLACTFYRMIFKADTFSLKACLVGILSFRTAPYSWYVEMYLGFFLIVPFLNRMYNGNTKKMKELLILILLLLTAVPCVVNVWNLTSLAWWKNPVSSEAYTPLIPDSWSAIYPFTYYFIGAYLKEYPLKLRIRYAALIILGIVPVLGIISVYRFNGGEFGGDPLAAYQSLPITVVTVMVFHIFNRMNMEWVGDRGRKVLKFLSEWTFGAYLCSYIFDDLFYDFVNEAQAFIPYRLVYFPLMVPAVAVCSLLLSWILNVIYGLAEKTVIKICSKEKKEAPGK